jgi:hypothetical protein
VVDSDWFMIHMILWISLIILIWLWQEESTGRAFPVINIQKSARVLLAQRSDELGPWPFGTLGKSDCLATSTTELQKLVLLLLGKGKSKFDPNVQRITQKYYVIDVIVTYYNLVVHVPVPHRRIAISSNMISSSRHLDTLFDLSKDLHRLVGREWPEMKLHDHRGCLWYPMISY